MNILYVISRTTKKIGNIVRLVYYILFQKPLYSLIYNMRGNVFKCKGILTSSRIMLNGKGNSIIIENGVWLNKVKIDIVGSNNVLILRKNVRFTEGGWIRLQDNNNKLEIGDNSRMINVWFALGDNNQIIQIGKDCLFSASVILRTNDGHSVLDENHNRINYPTSITIGDRVWLGYGVNVLKGSCIGNDSVVGTQSLVTGCSRIIV